MSIRLRHLSMPRWTSRLYFPAAAVSRLKSAIAEAEEKSGHTIVFAFESSLTTSQVLRGVSLKKRARELFSRLQVWDTAENSGVLIYLNLAEPKLTFIPDRGLQLAIDETKITEVNERVEPLLRSGKFLEAVLEAIQRLA